MKTLQIAIADDHLLFRKGLISLIEIENDMKVALEAANGLEITRRIGKLEVDVVLMDTEMPEMDGIEATRILRKQRPDLKIVMLSAHKEKQMVLHAIENGAHGYLLKDSAPYELAEAIRTVIQNGFCFHRDISHLLLKGIVEKDQLQPTFNPLSDLTEREIEVLKLICEELTSAEIGERLFLSPRTVETYRKNLLEKVGARNTVGLVFFALKHGLVEME